MGQWRVLIAQTVSGTIVADVAPKDVPQFTRKLSDKGSWTVDVLPEDTANTHLDLHAYTESGLYSWVVAYDDVIVQAGPVRTYQWDDPSRTLSVSGSGIQGLFDSRVLRNPSGTASAIAGGDNTLTLTNLSLGGVASAIVSANLSQSGYGLPINIPTPASGTDSQTYNGYDLASVWTRLNDLSQMDQGPELDFRPYFVTGANGIRWDMLIGSPTLGDPNSSAVWDYGGALSQVDIDTNGSASPASRVYVQGSGTEGSTLAGYAENAAILAEGYPGLDYVDTSHTAVTASTDLSSIATATSAAYAAPTETWTCLVHVDGLTTGGVSVSPTLGTWALGDGVLIGVSGHPWITDGVYRRRCLSISQDTDVTVSVVLQSTVEVL